MALRGCPCCNRGHRCITAPGIATTSRHLPRAIADSAIDPTEGLFMRLPHFTALLLLALLVSGCADRKPAQPAKRSEAHTSELQSLMLITYAVFYLKQEKHNN